MLVCSQPYQTSLSKTPPEQPLVHRPDTVSRLNAVRIVALISYAAV